MARLLRGSRTISEGVSQTELDARVSVATTAAQGVGTGNAVTFATVDTGQGANELYDMDQNVLVASDVNFESFKGGDYNSYSTTIASGAFTTIFALSTLDAGIWYYLESYLAGNQYSGTYWNHAIFQRSALNANAILCAGTNSNYTLRIEGGNFQATENASGGSYGHVTVVRKLMKF